MFIYLKKVQKMDDSNKNINLEKTMIIYSPNYMVPEYVYSMLDYFSALGKMYSKTKLYISETVSKYFY